MVLPERCTHRADRMPAEVRRSWSGTGQPCTPREQRPLWSTDYPHTGSDWPNHRVTVERLFRGVPKVDVKKMLHANCKALYRLDHIPDTLP